MLLPGYLFLISLSLFLVVAFITRQETVRGKRFVLAAFRGWCDRVLGTMFAQAERKIETMVRHTIKLSWYYSIHSTLRAILTVLVKTYDRLELVFMSNKERAKVLRAEKRALQNPNHLTVISEHKASTALTPSQKKKLKAKTLAGH